MFLFHLIFLVFFAISKDIKRYWIDFSYHKQSIKQKKRKILKSIWSLGKRYFFQFGLTWNVNLNFKFLFFYSTTNKSVTRWIQFEAKTWGERHKTSDRRTCIDTFWIDTLKRNTENSNNSNAPFDMGFVYRFYIFVKNHPSFWRLPISFNPISTFFTFVMRMYSCVSDIGLAPKRQDSMNLNTRS